MSNIVKMKARHFENTTYGSLKYCPLANAIREHFNAKHVEELVYICEVDGVTFGHKAYTRNDYDKDMAIAIEKKYNDNIIRTIELVEI